MIPEVSCGIPVRSFDHAKVRLRAAVPDALRRRLMEEMAARTARAAEEAGMDVTILSADDEVGTWTRKNGWKLRTARAETLDGAASSFAMIQHGEGRPWTVLHADLPLVGPGDLALVRSRLQAGRAVISPSADGGTSLVGTPGDLVLFAYGPGSFRRHLHNMRVLDPEVIASPHLACDLDLPDDLFAAATRPEGAWLRTLLGTLAAS